MNIRIGLALLLSIAFITPSRLSAQSIDYLRHNKIFNLCSYKLECSGCYDCNMQRYTVKVKNLVNKSIKQVSYQYFSETRKRVYTKVGVITGGLIDYNQIGFITMCLPNKLHWAITEIVYDDDSKVTFEVKDRLDLFVQEPDECDCNKPKNRYPNPNIK
jgi:hypothetical protein